MQGAVVRQRPEIRHIFKAPAVQDILRCTVLFAAARACVLGTFPFGVACFAAFLNLETAYLGLLAVGLAILSANGGPGGYLLACILYWIYAELRLREKNPLASMGICGICVFAGGLYSALTSGNAFYSFMILAGESVLSGLMLYVFQRGECFLRPCREQPAQEDLVCGVILLGVFLMGIAGLPLPWGIDLSMILGIFILLSVALHTGLAATGCFGLAIGFICSMNRPEAVLLSGIFGVSAVFANLLRSFGKLGVSLGFLLGITISLLYIGDINAIPVSVAELFLSCILFALAPGPIHQRVGGRISAVFEGRDKKSDRRVKQYLSGELKSFAKAFGDLAENFLTVPEHKGDIYEENLTAFIDEVADRACGGCRKAGECWNTKEEDTRRQAYMIFEIMEREGYCDIYNLPIVFKNRCLRPEEFVTVFNHVYELYKQNTLWKGEATFGRGLVARQYNEISNIMRGLSYEVEGGFCFSEQSEKKIADRLTQEGVFVKEVSVVENARGAYEVEITPGIADLEQVIQIVSEVLGMPMQIVSSGESWTKLAAASQFRVEIGIRQQTKEGETVSGDTLQYFETAENKFFIVLCDGMGSGGEASDESGKTASLMADFLKAGIDKETAVNMINSTLALKTGRESFTTVDMAEIDLRTGETSFLKVGSAPSYVKHKDTTETIAAKTLPIGILEEARPALLSRALCGGDIVVLASDGISEAGYGAIRGEWIKKTMQGGYTMDTLADLILGEAAGKAYPKLSDDMTVVCIQLEKI